MTARVLLATFDAISLLAWAAWLGTLTYRIARIWPAIGPGTRGASARTLLAKTSTWGVVLGAIALAAGVTGPLTTPELRGPGVGIRAILAIGGILVMLASGHASPAAIAGAIADPGALGKLRRRGRIGDVIVFAIGIGLLAAQAARPSPTTPGIVEPGPVERARRAIEDRRGAGSGPGRPEVEGGSRSGDRHTLEGSRDPGPAQPAGPARPAGGTQRLRAR